MNVVALPNGLRRFSLEDIQAEPWRNGGDLTRQIAAGHWPGRRLSADVPDGGGWDWRVSLADIRSSGPFSVFADMDRQAALAEGKLLTLRANEAAMHFPRVGDVHAFGGELELAAELAAGPVRLFNVMTRRGRVAAEVTAHHGGADLQVADGAGLVLLVVSGEFRVAFRGAHSPSDIELQVCLGEGFHLSGWRGRLCFDALTLDACLLVAKIHSA